jgi:hypothetical protein
VGVNCWADQDCGIASNSVHHAHAAMRTPNRLPLHKKAVKAKNHIQHNISDIQIS